MTMDAGELQMILLDVLPLRPKRHVRGKFIEVLFIADVDKIVPGLPKWCRILVENLSCHAVNILPLSNRKQFSGKLVSFPRFSFNRNPKTWFKGKGCPSRRSIEPEETIEGWARSDN